MVVCYGAEQRKHSTQKLKSFMSGPKYKYNNYDKKKNQGMDNNHFLYILGGNWCNVNNIDCQNLRICIKILGVNYNAKSKSK